MKTELKMIGRAGAVLCAFACCGFKTLPLEKVANCSRTDATAEDGKGGWLDLGSNDMSILPDGEQVIGGIPFGILPAGGEDAKNCLVLGRKGAEEVVWEMAQPVGDTYFYLLHAVAATDKCAKDAKVGDIFLEFKGGKTQVREVKLGLSASDWLGGRGYRNAARAWTEYNGNTQISLYVSAFELLDSKKLVRMTFKATGACPWMVVGVTAGPRVQVQGFRTSQEIPDVCREPAPPARPLQRFAPGARPKNVILVIGDGMGQGAARLTSYHKYGRDDALYFQKFPVAGLCTTVNALGETTDSAASSTAFATGTKTLNSCLGLQADATHPRTNAVRLTSIAVRAKTKGMGVALVTSDRATAATPAGFFAHVTDRGRTVEISDDAATCGFDVLVGNAATLAGFLPKDRGGKRDDGRDLLAEMATRGYACVTNQTAFEATPKANKVIGGLADFKADDSIANAMKAAFARLADNPKGFFMMAECAATDGGGHRNSPSLSVRGVTQVEFMAQAAVDFAQKHDDTLVIVTADHETGGIVATRGTGPDAIMSVLHQTTSHSSMPVPIHAYGPGAEQFEGLIDNTDIAKTIARLLALPVAPAIPR